MKYPYKNLMNESWKFLTEIHNFRDLPKDDIPEIGDVLMWESHL